MRFISNILSVFYFISILFCFTFISFVYFSGMRSGTVAAAPGVAAPTALKYDQGYLDKVRYGQTIHQTLVEDTITVLGISKNCTGSPGELSCPCLIFLVGRRKQSRTPYISNREMS